MVEPRSCPEQAEPPDYSPSHPLSLHDSGIATSPALSPTAFIPHLALQTCPPAAGETAQGAQTPLAPIVDSSPATPRTPVLQLRTDIPSVYHQPQQYHHQQSRPEGQDHHQQQQQQPSLLQQGSGFEHHVHLSRSTASLPRRIPSIRHALAEVHSSAGSLSPGSAFSSPQLAGLSDITPLPSPIQLASPPWGSTSTFSLSRVSSTASNRELHLPPPLTTRPRPAQTAAAAAVPASSASTGAGPASPDTLNPSQLSAPKRDHRHTRNRSLSEYVPPALQVHPATRKAAASEATPPRDRGGSREGRIRPNLQREEYLAAQRGISVLPPPLPTPPSAHEQSTSGILDGAVYNVQSIRSKQPRRYRWQSLLGQGAFSQVVLAAREEDGAAKPHARRLVAVKIVEYGPAGGADEERVEVSLNREVEILKSIDHPSIVQLKAFGSEPKRALLVLDYCPGGDLFEFASMRMKRIDPPLIERIFSELVDAVRYLHRNHIVHRDIKLENVLLNIPFAMMQDIPDWRLYPRAVITLTDLGLSRRIPQPPESPLLRTRCGSEDYAAPEILMGQPYDGRSTDAWALGVLLYAIMENRLPFDPLPGTRGDPAKLRARTPHRIARCEWSWYRYADGDGDWDPVKGRELEGARRCVEALLKRGSKRMHLDDVADMDWVRDAIAADVLPLKRGDIEVP
ncbi:putative tRNA (cytidine(32)/guanosine(34)-2'-O)-methyltransferase [Microsporum canis]|uniref:Ribosomal protein S6 kinase alpha-4 n=1 Tax=Arthroderma otae (strain ATCC MYA-4605 / CBS 113480) TaxID=554155 RepID=C5FN01_ARTOC|nr:catalytic protein kinase domain-containing protein [Microsporum canis CBS 113480]EEQ31237.1 ribosomal protein S6 kinase alpha-4 [Microsporum canis CBS 113480]